MTISVKRHVPDPTNEERGRVKSSHDVLQDALLGRQHNVKAVDIECVRVGVTQVR